MLHVPARLVLRFSITKIGTSLQSKLSVLAFRVSHHSHLKTGLRPGLVPLSGVRGPSALTFFVTQTTRNPNFCWVKIVHLLHDFALFLPFGRRCSLQEGANLQDRPKTDSRFRVLEGRGGWVTQGPPPPSPCATVQQRHPWVFY